uniref:Uncharacterized protein n=1 Tax=Solanum lycopersicum TaxID=4081 RepID=A0A3Q7IMM5_SOLLC
MTSLFRHRVRLSGVFRNVGVDVSDNVGTDRSLHHGGKRNGACGGATVSSHVIFE